MDPLTAAMDGLHTDGSSCPQQQQQQQQHSDGSGTSADELSPLSSPRATSSPVPVPGSNPDAVTPPRRRAQQQQGGASSAAAGAAAGAGSSAGGPPPLSPPDPELQQDVLDRLLQQASPVISERFSMSEFLAQQRQALASAARRELGGATAAAAADGGDDVGSCLEGSSHGAELSRQAAHVSGVVEGVGEESRVNRELAALLVERFDSSRNALQCLLRLLTCLMEAEAAYSSAMSAAAKAASAGPLAAPTDSTALASAVDGLVQLPAAAAAGHRQLYLELQLLVDGVRGLWAQYNNAAKELKTTVYSAQRAVDGCCKQLAVGLAEHCAACKAFDASIVWQAAASSPGKHKRAGSASVPEASAVADAARPAGGGVGVLLRPRFAAAPAKDPWASEGRLVAEQQALQRWQDQERQLLQRGFDVLQSLEQERVSQLAAAGTALAAAYASAVAGLPAAADSLRGMLQGLGGAGEAGLAHLAQVAADMRATSEALAARQACCVTSVAQELFASPEIVRQGPMELWNGRTSAWTAVHWVLTRAGFLHCFASMEDVAPAEPPLNLSRCEFEAGQAPVFHLVEAGSGGWLVGRAGRKVTLKASSVEECCEWAIALREAIALSSGGAAAAGGGGVQHSSSRGLR